MSQPFETIDKYIEDAMASWQVPGAAVAVLKGGEVIHLKGYGVRDLETCEPINPDTGFAIASCSKAFTAMDVALLVDENVLEWDKPVRDYLPEFKLSDGYVSERITVRDLLCHRSGLPRHDLSWYGSGFDRAQVIANLAHLRFNKGFREVWQYQNLMYVTAGYLAGKMTGQTWEEVTRTRIFEPLAMKRSSFSPDTMQAQGNFARPYRIHRGAAEGEPDRLEAMPFYSDEAMGPAGSIHSTAADLANWLEVHLNEGRFRGQPFVSPGNLAQMHQPQMVLPVDGLSARLHNTTLFAYGLGWFVQPYRGYTLIHHGGNIDGFSTMVAFVPQEKIGIVVLTNLDSRPLRDILTFEICDRLLGLPDNRWNQRIHAQFAELFAATDRDRQVADQERVANAPPSHPLSAYEGEYAAPGYADIEVKLDGDQLSTHFAGGWWPLSHYHYDVFNLTVERFEMRLPVRFLTDEQGQIDALWAQIEPEVEPILFRRKPLALDEALLASLAGRYQMPLEGVELVVVHKHGKLFVLLTGQTEEELLPLRRTPSGVEFRVRGATGARVEFERDAQGQPTAALLKQPGSVFRAPRLA